MNESQATTSLLRKLKENGHFWKASDRFVAGVPDIVGCLGGRFVGIEMKVDYNTPSPLQTHVLLQIIKHKGYAAVVTYSNKHKSWWILGKEFSLGDAVLHIIGKIGRGENDIEAVQLQDGTI